MTGTGAEIQLFKGLEGINQELYGYLKRNADRDPAIGKGIGHSIAKGKVRLRNSGTQS